MKRITLSNKIFYNEETAIAYLESKLWLDGPVCPKCGGMDKAYKIKSKTARLGTYKCGHCKKQYRVTVGTIFEGSHIKIHQWLQAIFLYCSSKKGFSAKQLERNLGITYKSAWFLGHRIREIFKDDKFFDQLGGEGKVVEADETYWGLEDGAEKAKGGWNHKRKIFSLVERNGAVRSFHVKKVDGITLKPILKKQVNKETHIMTDDMGAYSKLNTHFDNHDIICHSKGEYSRGNIHTNTIEGFFSILKRGLDGVYQWVSTHHLHRYITEFDFRYSHRKITDTERFNVALNKVTGKRLYYSQPFTLV